MIFFSCCADVRKILCAVWVAQSIIGEVNNIINAFRSEKYISDVDSILAGSASTSGEDADQELDDEPDEEDVFAPERGNVAFGSAGDGWAFRIEQFADLYAAKLGASVQALKRALWGDHYYNAKTKKIVGKKAAAGRIKPMFVQFVLEPLWQVYDTAMQGDKGMDMLQKIIKSMNLAVPPRDLQHKDLKVVVQSVMSRWLPISDTVLSMVLEVLPDPATAQANRIIRLLPTHEFPAGFRKDVQAQLDTVRKAVELCDESNDAPCVVYVSKMFAVPVELLPRHDVNGELLSNLGYDLGVGDGDSAQKECFLAFARVFSGVLRAGQNMFVISGLYDPTDSKLDTKTLQESRVEALYMMMGRGLEPRASASAGNVVAIRGLGQDILKTATLSSTPYCWPFQSMNFQAAPIVRVAIEPKNPTDIRALARGLKLLNKADPFVEVSVSGNGEHVLAAAGEVHLERCVTDLRERFARIELEVSPPLVAFRETIEPVGAECQQSGHSMAEFMETTTPNKRCTVRVYLERLPAAILKVLDDSQDLLKGIVEGRPLARLIDNSGGHAQRFSERLGVGEDPLQTLKASLIAAASEDDPAVVNKKVTVWTQRLERMWSLGPRRVGSNILLTPSSSGRSRSLSGPLMESDVQGQEHMLVKGQAHVSKKLGLISDTPEVAPQSTSGAGDSDDVWSQEVEGLESSIIAGFQLATAQGPLCEEPMWGLVFTVEARVSRKAKGPDHAEVGDSHEMDIASISDQYGPFSGQVMTAVKDACRSAMLARSPRIAEALYFAEVSTTPEHLGQVYAVLGRRRARVLKEEMREGSAMFLVHAYMPVAESFGFADELRRKTSGAASPLLVLSHWEALSQDPFFVPKTEEELEEFGDGSNVPPNTARKLIDAVRRRKGLPVEEKVVQFATKQRTRARKV